MNNMNFTPENIDRILSGSKTVTRRPLKTALGEKAIKQRYASQSFYIEKIVRGDHDKWVNGEVYRLAIEGIEYHFGQVRIIGIRTQNLWDMTDYDLEDEGVDSLDEFERIWNLCYADHPEYQWAANPVVIVIELEVVK